MKETQGANAPLIDERFLEDLPPPRPRPEWVRRESIACVGAWEPLHHRRRTGTNHVNDEAAYAWEHSEAFVHSILDVGANLLITAYDKNYVVDEDEFALKRQLAACCRKHGLRLGVYLRADQLNTERLADRMRGEDLMARRADGSPAVYGNQEWRRNICFHKRDNLEAFRESIRRAITELGVDLLHLDGLQVGGTETYGACRCEACRRDFTQFLIRRWGGDAARCRRRFGHTEIENIEPPGLFILPAIPTGRVADPVWQEWIRFRCTWTARIVRLISGFVHTLDPAVAILGNGALAVRENTALLCGFEAQSYGAPLDIVCNEDGYDPRITADGTILQRARQCKLGSAGGGWLFNYMHNPARPERDLKVRLAHAAAFNRGRITCLGSAPTCYTDYRLAGATKRRFADWLGNHWEHFQDLETVADVTVWREARAMAFAEPLAHATAMRVEQLLIEDRLPFDIAPGAWPAGTRVLAIPQLAFLDDAQCEAVADFVKSGGAALVIGESSVLDGWGRRRLDLGLRAVLPPSVRLPGLFFEQHIAGTGDPVAPGHPPPASSHGFVYHEAGKGRVVYVPGLVPSADQPALLRPDHTYDFSLDLTHWRPPEQADELRRALCWLRRDRFTVEVEAGRGLLANYYRQPATHRLYVHLLNLTERPVSAPVVRMPIPSRSEVSQVEVFSPDGPEARSATWSITDGLLRVTPAAVDVYAVVAIRTSPRGAG